jgi:exosortase
MIPSSPLRLCRNEHVNPIQPRALILTPKQTIPSIAESKIPGGVSAPSPMNRSLWKLALALAPFCWLWFRLIDNLRFDWSTNPQYSYGWLVPFICLGLLIERRLAWPGSQENGAGTEVRRRAIMLLALFAFLFLPTRLIEAATPEWTAVQWALGIEAVGATLCAVYLLGGPAAARQWAFPICFFFVAIPWPTFIENRLIQSLTRADTAVAINLLTGFGIPAVQHGNLIEVSTGTVGVDEACSGIRSLHTTLMISLFLGEFYRFNLRRRLLLIPPGFVLAMAFNVCRMTLLTWIAAKKGMATISRYHDPAGVTIAILCASGLWLLSWLFNRHALRAKVSHPFVPTLVQDVLQPIPKGCRILCLGLLCWLFTVEVGVKAWYHIRESHLKFSRPWTVIFPSNNSTLRTNAIPESTSSLLGYDEGQDVEWDEKDGSHWSVFFASWFPGRAASYLATRHTPEICMSATGCKLVSGPNLEVQKMDGAVLPLKNYTFATDSGPLYVIHCRWEAGVDADKYVEHEGGRFNLVRGVWEGRGNKGQKVLEIIVSGYASAAQAREAVARQLKKMVVVEKPAVDAERAQRPKATRSFAAQEP